MLFDAPLAAKANPGLSPNPTKAPWYFAGVQELLLHFHPVFSLFVIPGLVLLALIGLPYIDFQDDTAGVWFASAKGRRTAAVAAAVAAIVTPAGIVADEIFIDFNAWLPGIPPVVGNGIIPTIGGLIAMAAFFVMVKRKYAATNNETVQAIFVLILVAFLVMTATGVWFRGEGMRLVWPGGG
jgi:hypothetical protein